MYRMNARHIILYFNEKRFAQSIYILSDLNIMTNSWLNIRNNKKHIRTIIFSSCPPFCLFVDQLLTFREMSWYTQLLPLIGKKGSSQMCLPQAVVSKVVSDN